MSEFTQGKWEYHEYIPEGISLNGTEYLISSEGENVALVRNEADAKLIAVAPEMFGQLVVIMHMLSLKSQFNLSFDYAHAADQIRDIIRLVERKHE